MTACRCEGKKAADARILELRNVVKTFGGLMAVHHVSFEIEPREIVALIGPNGSGKTTLFNLISGFLSPTQGEVWFDGRNLKGLAPHQIAILGIGRTFQNLQLFTNMSVVENVMVGRHLKSRGGLLQTAFCIPPTRAEERNILDSALKILAWVGLEKEVLEYPLSLPYGKQKLLGIARVLASEPKLLLMDEPAGGLSAHEIGELARLISSLRDGGITILVVEHRMELAMGIADKVIALNFGEKVAEGTPDEVRNNDQVITAYLGEEF